MPVRKPKRIENKMAKKKGKIKTIRKSLTQDGVKEVQNKSIHEQNTLPEKTSELEPAEPSKDLNGGEKTNNLGDSAVDFNPIDEIDLAEKMSKDKTSFLEAYHAHKNHASTFKFEDVVSSKTGELLEKMWDSLNDIATGCAIEMFPTDPVCSGNSDNEHSELAINGILLLGRLTLEFHATTAKKEEFVPPSGLTNTALLLHGILPSISSEKDAVKNNISKLCELWYTKNMPEHESLVFNTLKYILQRTTEKVSTSGGGAPTKADVKRLHSIQHAILQFNLTDTSSNALRDLLLESARTSMFYKISEGIRFLSFLFTISPTFIEHLHSKIKTIIPGANIQVATGIGEVYFKAWRSCEGAFKTNIEELCIQDLMQCAVLANPKLPKNIKIFPPIKNILKVLHRIKNDRQAQAMLAKLYEPIIWRHLKVANSHVRANSAQLFFDAFPIEDPNLRVEERSMKQENQVQIICELLKDESADIRVIAVAGASVVIAKYWQILSSTDLNKIFKIFVVDLAVDASSPLVRVEVLKGFKHILTSCVRSHLYLKKILPKICDSLHDIKDVVRQSMLDLLIAISNVKMIQYWDICSIDHLLARLEVEKSNPVCTKIVDLLFHSYFPLQENEDTKIKRCIHLIQQNQIASRRFYSFSPKFIPLHDQVKFMLAILVALKRNIKYKQGKLGKFSISSKSTQDLKSKDHRLPIPPYDSENTSNTSDGESEADKENNDSSVDGSFRSNRRKRKRLYTQPNKSLIVDSSPSILPPQDYTHSNMNSQESIDKSLSLDSSANVSLGLSDTSQIDTNADNQAVDDDYIQELESEKTVAALLDVVCILWMARSTDIVKEENVEYRSLLEKKTSKLVSVLFKYYRSSDVSRSLIYLCSFLPYSSVSTMAGFCLSQIRNSSGLTDIEASSNDSSKENNIEKGFDLAWTGNQTEATFSRANSLRTYIDALCNWNRGDDMLELVTNWISRDLRERQVKNRRSGGAGKNKNIANRKGVRFSESAGLGAAKPKLALKIIRYMFRHPVNREILIKKNRSQVEELKETLRKFVDEFVYYLPIDNGIEIEEDKDQVVSNQTYLCEVLQSLLTLTILLHSSNSTNIEGEGEKSIDKKVRRTSLTNQSTANYTKETTGQSETDIFIVLEELLEWGETKLIALPQLSRDIFSLRLLNSLINACSNTVTLRIADINFIGLSLEFAKNVLDTINVEKKDFLPPQSSNTEDCSEDQNLAEALQNVISACITPVCR